MRHGAVPVRLFPARAGPFARESSRSGEPARDRVLLAAVARPGWARAAAPWRRDRTGRTGWTGWTGWREHVARGRRDLLPRAELVEAVAAGELDAGLPHGARLLVAGGASRGLALTLGGFDAGDLELDTLERLLALLARRSTAAARPSAAAAGDGPLRRFIPLFDGETDPTPELVELLAPPLPGTSRNLEGPPLEEDRSRRPRLGRGDAAMRAGRARGLQEDEGFALDPGSFEDARAQHERRRPPGRRARNGPRRGPAAGGLSDPRPAWREARKNASGGRPERPGRGCDRGVQGTDGARPERGSRGTKKSVISCRKPARIS